MPPSKASYTRLTVRLVAAVVVVASVLLATGCGSAKSSRESQCYDWLSRIASGEVGLDSVQRSILGDPASLDEDVISDICFLANDWKLIAPHGVITPGALSLVLPCVFQEGGCGLPSFEQKLIVDRRLQRLPPEDRYVLLVAASKLTTEGGTIDPVSFRPFDPRHPFMTLGKPRGPIALRVWARMANVPPTNVREAVRDALAVKLLRTVRLLEKRACDPFAAEPDLREGGPWPCELRFDERLLPRLPRYDKR
jgi:hypothetical protein